MLGRKTVEEKLRESNGQEAMAFVLERKDGAAIALGIDHNLSTGVPKWMDHEGDIQKHSYTLRVEPLMSRNSRHRSRSAQIISMASPRQRSATVLSCCLIPVTMAKSPSTSTLRRRRQSFATSGKDG